MDRLSPISTDSGFESCCCPSSPVTSSSNTSKASRSLFVPSLPSSSTALASPSGDAHRVLCDLTPSSSEASLCREDSLSLDSLSTTSRNNDCSVCSTCIPSDSASSDSCEEPSCPSQPRYIDGGSVRYHCLWSRCGNIYEKADDLYDHVTELHINVLREVLPQTSRGKQEKEDDEPIKCKWDDCTMFLRRGDQEKKICWLMDHYRTRHARAANPFHCVIEGCQMRFSTTNRLEEHVRLEHINPPKQVKETPVVVERESCYGWRPRVYYPVRPRPTVYCPHFDEQLLKCVRFMNKHNFNVTFSPVDFCAGLKGAKRRKRRHRYAYRIDSYDPVPAEPEKRATNAFYDVDSVRGLSIYDLFPSVQNDDQAAEPSLRNSDA